MFGLFKKERKKPLIEVRKLRKPRMKGESTIGLFTRITGFLDNKNGMIRMEGIRFYSPWISRKQSCFHRYSAKMFNVAGEIMKPAYIQREKLNDELKKYKNRLIKSKLQLTEELPLTIEQKRNNLYVRREMSSIEEKITADITELKEIKIAIEEAEHELNQILQEKKHIVETQIFNYLRGAKKMPDGTELLVENEISRSLFNRLGNGFEYNLEAEELLRYEEKESVENEHIQ